METKSELVGEIRVLDLVGRIELRQARDLDLELRKILARGEKYLIADLGAVENLDSHGLRVLLKVARRLEAVDGRLVLCSVPPQVRQALDVAGLEFLQAEDRAAALVALPEQARLSRAVTRAAEGLGIQKESRGRKSVIPGEKPAQKTVELAELALRALAKMPLPDLPTKPGDEG